MTAFHTPSQIPELRQPADINWAPKDGVLEARINGHRVALLSERPKYCDRGRFQVHCDLPGVDVADCFPRYFMSRMVAIWETTAWLRWRLWRQPPNQRMPDATTKRSDPKRTGDRVSRRGAAGAH